MPGFLRVAVVPHSAHLMRLLGLMRFMAPPRSGVGRGDGEHSQGQEARQRTQALIHSMDPPRTNRTNHDPCGWGCRENTTAPLLKKADIRNSDVLENGNRLFPGNGQSRWLGHV